MVFSADEAHGARRGGGLGCGPMVHTQEEEFKIVRVVVLRHTRRCRDFAWLKRADQTGRDENHQLGFVSTVLYVSEESAENRDVAEQWDTSIGGPNTVI